MADKQTWVSLPWYSLVEQRNQITGLGEHALDPVLRPGSAAEASIISSINWSRKISDRLSFRCLMDRSPGFGKSYSELLRQ